MVSDPCGAAKKNTLAPEHPFTQRSDHPCRIAQLLKFPRDYRRAIVDGQLDPLDVSRDFIPDDSTREIVSKYHNRTCYSYYNIASFHRDLEIVRNRA